LLERRWSSSVDCRHRTGEGERRGRLDDVCREGLATATVALWSSPSPGRGAAAVRAKGTVPRASARRLVDVVKVPHLRRRRGHDGDRSSARRLARRDRDGRRALETLLAHGGAQSLGWREERRAGAWAWHRRHGEAGSEQHVLLAKAAAEDVVGSWTTQVERVRVRWEVVRGHRVPRWPLERVFGRSSAGGWELLAALGALAVMSGRCLGLSGTDRPLAALYHPALRAPSHQRPSTPRAWRSGPHVGGVRGQSMPCWRTNSACCNAVRHSHCACGRCCCPARGHGARGPRGRWRLDAQARSGRGPGARLRDRGRDPRCLLSALHVQRSGPPLTRIVE
jgi:hypothetical protein